MKSKMQLAHSNFVLVRTLAAKLLTTQPINSDNSEAALFVDAENAFNSLNHSVALHNVLHLCPPLGCILVNTYRNLYIDGETLLYINC